MRAEKFHFEPKPYLREIALLRGPDLPVEQFPFSLPVIRAMEAIRFHPDVTFFVGENGSGKSTLLEAIAQALHYNPEGGNKNIRFATRETHSSLAAFLKVVRGPRMPKDGFFLRAESFYNVASYIDDLGYEGAYGGKSLHAQSHGESFLSLLTHKMKGSGLYLMDEPEAALSPTRQLAVLARIHELVQADSQFIIATHSPILLAYPHAKIYQLAGAAIDEVSYEETDAYRVTKDFLTQRERMLKILLDEA